MLHVREEGSTTIETLRCWRKDRTNVASRVPLQLPMVTGSVGTVESWSQGFYRRHSLTVWGNPREVHKRTASMLRMDVKTVPNALGANDNRRIPVRQRQLHPSMCGYLDLADTSNSDPGQTTSLSPYCDLKSMYFDDSLYENEMHYKLDKLKDEFPLDDDWSELRIEAANETEYNEMLDKLYHYTKDRIRIFGVSNNPMEIIVEKDPRENYRQFDEEKYLVDEKPHTESQS